MAFDIATPGNDSTIGRTVVGDWPFLGDGNYVAVVPAYTRALVDKLVNADADVAAAVNAAAAAQAAAATITYTAWAALTMGNGWGAGPKVSKWGRLVSLQGLTVGGTKGAVACTLPAGMRPPVELYLPAIGIDSAWAPIPANIQILANGQVSIRWATGVTPTYGVHLVATFTI